MGLLLLFDLPSSLTVGIAVEIWGKGPNPKGWTTTTSEAYTSWKRNATPVPKSRHSLVGSHISFPNGREWHRCTLKVLISSAALGLAAQCPTPPVHWSQKRCSWHEPVTMGHHPPMPPQAQQPTQCRDEAPRDPKAVDSLIGHTPWVYRDLQVACLPLPHSFLLLARPGEIP